jgi:hypothetical protein
MITINGCQLEIDENRGVIYVHGPMGWTLLRICRLPTPIPDPQVDLTRARLLDITHMHGVDWAGSGDKRG